MTNKTFKEEVVEGFSKKFSELFDEQGIPIVNDLALRVFLLNVLDLYKQKMLEAIDSYPITLVDTRRLVSGESRIEHAILKSEVKQIIENI